MKILLKPLILTVTLLNVVFAASSLLAQSQNTGILLLAHGGSDAWNEEVLKVRQQIDSNVPAEAAFGMATKRTIQEAADRLTRRGVTKIVAVPLFVSPHSSILTATEYLLGLRPDAPPELARYAQMDHGTTADEDHIAASSTLNPMAPIRSVPISMAGALGRHPLVAEILSSRARAISREPKSEVVIVVAHGPVSDEENVKWLDDMAALVEQMRSSTSFQNIDCMTLRDDAPEPIRSKATAELRTKVEYITQQGKRALIIPLLLSYGGIEPGIKKRLEGLSYVMSPSALLPDDRIAQWVVLAAQGAAGASAPNANQTSRASGQVEQLQEQVQQLSAEMERLRSRVESASPKTQEPPPIEVPTDRQGQIGKPEAPGRPQFSARPDDPEIAVPTKAQGGDLSGAGTLLRNERITVGGYGDVQFRESSINERADGGGLPTFQSTRFVLGIAAVLAQKQNITFNSEIEYEFGSREIDVEQAFIEWRVRPEFGFRGGIVVPAIGRFNTYHDSNLNLATIRPLLNQFIVPTAYRDTGIGVRGRFKLPHDMRLTYEANLINGMQSLNADGEPTPFSRLLGQSSAAEPGLVGFQSPNRRKAVAGRIGLSPMNGFEFGVSAYNGRFNQQEESLQSATLLFVDGSYHRGSIAINGEYGRSNIVGGIPRRSPAPPVFDPSFPDTVAALSQFVADKTPGQDGFYLEGAYYFHPEVMQKHFDEGSYWAPVVRFEGVRRDRTLDNFYLNERRTTVGVNIAPSTRVIFKFGYAFNHPLGPLPSVSGPIGGADFGKNPIPFLNYGKNGFAGSVAYVF